MDASSIISERKYESDKSIALLVGQYGSRDFPSLDIQEESLHELFLLSDTIGIKNTYEMMVKNAHPHAGTFFSEGVINKFKENIIENQINLIIIDVNLRPGQIKSLEEILKVRVIGRVELILDIFAMRAKTKEAALQVELAQLTYILPRLKGLGGVLSRLGGGIGTRGPGETMLETDRRHIRKRLQKIKQELVQVSKHRQTMRKNRSLPTFALVGYTNAGKTSLLNRLSSSAKQLFAEDRLFATLDSYARKVYLGEIDYKPVYSVLSDTVGFIRNLPVNLAAAFKSTLEEILYVDVVIIVADSSSFRVTEEIEVVRNELEKLGVNDKKTLLFFNKDDVVFPEDRLRLSASYPGAVWGNTLSKDSVKDLRGRLYNLTCEMAALQKGEEIYNSQDYTKSG